ncbi:serine/threonine-protein kinase RsbW [Azospirillaceae bacterium]
MTHQRELRIASRLEEIPRLTDWIEAFCDDHALPPRVGFHFTLALDEILTNVIEYAYDDAAGDAAGHTILVRLELEPGPDGGVVAAEIIDDGRAYDPTSVPDPDTTLGIEDRPIGGLGIFFVRQMMDTTEYVRDGELNRLRIARRVNRETNDMGAGQDQH